MAAFLFKFEWDPAKDRTNVGQHGVDFERAVEVFRDPFGSFQPGGGPGPKCGSMRNSMKPEYDFSNASAASSLRRTPSCACLFTWVRTFNVT